MSRHRPGIFELYLGEGSDDESHPDISDLDEDYRPNLRDLESETDDIESDVDNVDTPTPSTSNGVRRKRRDTASNSKRKRQKRTTTVNDSDEIDHFHADGSDDDDSSNSNEDQGQDNNSMVRNDADWSQCLDDFPNNPSFTGDSGVKIDVDEASVLSCFQLFFGRDMIKLLKEQTNKYAADVKAQQSHRLTQEGHNVLKDWRTVTMKDMKGFILILIHMGVVKKPCINDYWCTQLFVSSPFAATIMPRDRFKAILSMFHMSDNDTYLPTDHPDHDPLHKVRPVMEYLQGKFQEVYVPTKNIAIDEAMCSWRGRLRFKVYLKDKPNPWGIKFYCLCESGSGYVYRFEIYAAEKDVSNKPTDVVLRLLDPLMDKGYHVYTDNYYTCPALYEALTERGTDCTGTVRSNRVGMPKDLAIEKLKTGDISFRRKKNLCAVKWSDKRDVIILTSAHDPTATVAVTSRNCPSEKLKPVCVRDYTKNMCGVDQSDQLMAYIPLARRTMKWSKKIFIHLLTLSIVQANIVFNKIQKEKSSKTLSTPFFLKALGSALTEDYHTTEAPRPSTPARDPATNPQLLQRLNHQQFHHLVSLPPTSTKSKPRRECKVCRDVSASLPGKTKRAKEVYNWCKVCQVPLCMEPCFFLFHNRQNYIAAAKNHS